MIIIYWKEELWVVFNVVKETLLWLTLISSKKFHWKFLFEHGRIFVQCCTVFLYSIFVSYCTLHITNIIVIYDISVIYDIYDIWYLTYIYLFIYHAIFHNISCALKNLYFAPIVWHFMPYYTLHSAPITWHIMPYISCHI